MPIRFGRWWSGNKEPSPHHGYTSVEPRGTGGRLGTLTGFQITVGRPEGQLDYVGSTALITVEGWDFTQDPTGIGIGVAIRWDSGDSDDDIAADLVRWPQGPPCMFAGWVVEHPVRHLLGEDGDTHTIVTLTADDWLGSWSHQTPWQTDTEPELQHTVHDFILHGEGVRAATADAVPKNQVEGVILGDWTHSSGIAHDDDSLEQWQEVNIGQALQVVSVSTGTQIFMRHGHRLGSYAGSSPPDERDGEYTDALGDSRGRSRGKFFIRGPQLVVRQIGGPTTFDVEHVTLGGDGTGNTATAERELTFTPDADDPSTVLIPRRRVLKRAAEMEVMYPAPLDRVTMYGFHYDEDTPDDQQPRQFAESVTREGARERDFVEFSGLPVEDNPAFDGHLQIVADRMRTFNDNRFRVYRVDMPNLTDEEMNEWAGLGIADEVVIPRPDGTVQGQGICQIRQYQWNCSNVTGYNLTLWLAYHQDPIPDPDSPAPPVGARALWSGIIEWSQGADAKGGWRQQGGYGTLEGFPDDPSLDEFDNPDGDEVNLDAILRNRDGEIEITANSVANQDRLEGLWLQMRVPTLTVWVQIPATNSATATSIRVIPEAHRPPQQSPVFVSIWDPDDLPEDAVLTPVADPDPPPTRTVPDVVGDSEQMATGTLQGQMFTVRVVPQVTSDSTQVGNVISQSPTAGTSAPLGSEVVINVGVAEAPPPTPQVAVPNLVGQPRATAEAALTAENLVPSGTGTPVTDFEQANVVLTQGTPAGTMVDEGTTITFTYGTYNPVLLHSFDLVWGTGPAPAMRQGFAALGGTPDETYGSLSPTTVAVDGHQVTFEAIRRLVGTNDGIMRIDVDSPASLDALAGKWLRIEATGMPNQDVIFRIPDATGDNTQTPESEFPLGSVPVDGTTLRVQLWTLRPVGQTQTAGYPIAPAPPTPTVPTGVIDPLGVRGSQRGFDSYQTPYHGTLTPNPISVDGTDIDFTRILRLNSGNARVRCSTEAQLQALRGKWIRWVTTTPEADIAWRIPTNTSGEEYTTSIAPFNPDRSDRPEPPATVTITIHDADPRL